MRNIHRSIFFFICLIIIFFIIACSEPVPVKIGFSESITGNISPDSIYSMNAVKMAVENINNSGGINGRKIQLIVMDDKNTPEGVKEADESLINEGVISIIGHNTSARSLDALKIISGKNILMISPTTSTQELSRKNDNFFKLFLSTDQITGMIIKNIIPTEEPLRFGIIYDDSNKSYSDSWRNGFKSGLKNTKSSVYFEKEINTLKSEISESAAEDIRNCTNILIISNSINSAIAVNKIKIINPSAKIISSTWAFSEFDDFIKYSKENSDGIISVQMVDMFSQDKKMKDFISQYEEKYGSKFSISAVLSYETVYIIYEALKNMKKFDGITLKNEIIKISKFKGLTGDIIIDKYGDVVRDIYPVIIKKGQLEKYK